MDANFHINTNVERHQATVDNVLIVKNVTKDQKIKCELRGVQNGIILQLPSGVQYLEDYKETDRLIKVDDRNRIEALSANCNESSHKLTFQLLRDNNDEISLDQPVGTIYPLSVFRIRKLETLHFGNSLVPFCVIKFNIAPLVFNTSYYVLRFNLTNGNKNLSCCAQFHFRKRVRF